MRNLRKLAIFLAIIAVFAFAAVALAQTATPSITVRDQAVQNGTVMVDRVVAAQDGWVEIHADANGTPGAEVAHQAVKAGTTDNLVIKINEAVATPRMWAMLHIDAGTIGTWEFPGADVPVKLPNGDIVMAPFNVTGLSGAAAGTVTPEAGATMTATTEAMTTATPEATVAAAQAVTATATTAVTATATLEATPLATATVEATPTTAVTATTAAEVATATPEATTAVAAAGAATSTVSPSTLPTTGGSGNSTLVVLLLGLGGISLLAGIGLNLARRTR